jgi:hypothetical protein
MATPAGVEFNGMTCFLGRCEVAQINIGTKPLIPKAGYSNGRAKEKSLELNRFTLSAMRSASSNVASLQIQTNYTFVHIASTSNLHLFTKVADRHI